MSESVQVSVRIKWHEALAAVEQLAEMGKSRDFCERDVLRLEAVASSIQRMLMENSQ